MASGNAKSKVPLTHERLLSLVHYDPETGIFTAKIKRYRATVNKPLGFVHKRGYVRITINNTIHRAHTLAWFYVHGEWPAGFLDHRNLDKADNRIANLREATPSQNIINRPLQKNNRSGLKGVRWSPAKGRWLANIGFNSRLHHLGNFLTKEAASEAYTAAATRFHGDFARSA